MKFYSQETSQHCEKLLFVTCCVYAVWDGHSTDARAMLFVVY